MFLRVFSRSSGCFLFVGRRSYLTRRQVTYAIGPRDGHLPEFHRRNSKHNLLLTFTNEAVEYLMTCKSDPDISDLAIDHRGRVTMTTESSINTCA